MIAVPQALQSASYAALLLNCFAGRYPEVACTAHKATRETRQAKANYLHRLLGSAERSRPCFLPMRFATQSIPIRSYSRGAISLCATRKVSRQQHPLDSALVV